MTCSNWTFILAAWPALCRLSWDCSRISRCVLFSIFSRIQIQTHVECVRLCFVQQLAIYGAFVFGKIPTELGLLSSLQVREVGWMCTVHNWILSSSGAGPISQLSSRSHPHWVGSPHQRPGVSVSFVSKRVVWPDLFDRICSCLSTAWAEQFLLSWACCSMCWWGFLFIYFHFF